MVSRSVTDISVTIYEEEAQRAFDAAEAGIERALVSGSGETKTAIGDAEYTVELTNPVPAEKQFVYPTELLAGESATFWYVSHDDTGNMYCSGNNCMRANRIERVCWGKPGTDINEQTPAIEIAVVYDDNRPAAVNENFSQVKIARAAYDPWASRRASNNFLATTTCDSPISGKEFAFSTGPIAFNQPGPDGIEINCWNDEGCLLMAKVRMFYNYIELPEENFPHPVGMEMQLTANTDLPPQGTQIDSIGVAGETTRRVNVFQSYPEPPFVFDAALFGGGGLSKP